MLISCCKKRLSNNQVHNPTPWFFQGTISVSRFIIYLAFLVSTVSRLSNINWSTYQNKIIIWATRKATRTDTAIAIQAKSKRLKTKTIIVDTIGAVLVRPTATLRVADSIPARNKYLYGLHAVVPGLAIYVCDFSMFVNAPTIQELFLYRGFVVCGWATVCWIYSKNRTIFFWFKIKNKVNSITVCQTHKCDPVSHVQQSPLRSHPSKHNFRLHPILKPDNPV